MGRSALFIFRHAPYGSSLAREGLEAALAAGVYDQNIALLFLNDGLFQLTQGQEPATDTSKNHGRSLSALPLYGVEDTYVTDYDLSRRALSISDLLLPAKIVTADEVRTLLCSYDHLVSF